VLGSRRPAAANSSRCVGIRYLTCAAACGLSPPRVAVWVQSRLPGRRPLTMSAGSPSASRRRPQSRNPRAHANRTSPRQSFAVGALEGAHSLDHNSNLSSEGHVLHEQTNR
jgi:hypothetical protein